jgi:hypothetical protein
MRSLYLDIFSGISGDMQILQEVQTQNESPIAHRGRQMHVEQKGGVFPV